MRYLIIGPKMTDNVHTHGGTPVLVEQLLKYMNKTNKNYKFISTQHFGEGKAIANFLYTLTKLLINLPKVDIVIVNVSRNGAYYFSPIALFFSKLFKKRFVFRRFGGNCLELYEKAKGFRKKLIKFVFNNSDIMFFEPKYMVKYFKEQGKNAFWLPNSREASSSQRDLNLPYRKKFIFLGHIIKEKGIDEILKASQELDDSYEIKIYGSLKYGNYTKESFSAYSNVKYCGILEHSEVYNALCKSDVLLLPSYKEGYPGVIIEAFAVGLPVVVSKIDSILEMVDNSCAKVVDIKDSTALVEAIKSFNQENYRDFAIASKEKFKDYEINSVHKRMLQICEEDLV